MGRRSLAVDRARRRIDADLQRAVDDAANARRAAGLSLRDVAASCGVSKTTIARIETGQTGIVDLRLFACFGAAVGLDVRLHAYPAGDPIRDAGQQRLLERFRVRLHPSLGWRTEVPLPIDGDLRAWDALINGPDWRCHVEAETVIDDIQALERRLERKRRDGGVDHVILIVADTRRNRRALAAFPAAFSGMSRDARGVFGALRRGEDPGMSAIVMV
jgi:transcriptional regulator with XRE-family HTH domain